LRPQSSLPNGIEAKYTEPIVDPSPPQLDQLLAQNYLKDTIHHQGTMTERVFHGFNRMMATKMDGYVIIVPYYHKLVDPLIRSESISTGVENDIADSYRRINGLEIKMQDPLTGDYDLNDAQTQVVTRVVFYPGFVPKIGDFFLYPTAPDKLGKIEITSVTRLTFRSDTSYASDVFLSKYVDQADIDEYESRVSDVAFFDAEAFLLGKSVLLKTEERVLLDDIRSLEAKLKSYYIKKFFDRTWAYTIVREDGVYDPYVVEFVTRLFEWNEWPRYPARLIDAPADYDESYWAQLLDPNPIDYSKVKRYHELVKCTMVSNSTRITSLLNRTYVANQLEQLLGTEPYISTGLDPAAEEADDFELLVRMWLEHKKLDPTALLTIAQEYRFIEDPLDQFYRIPILILFIVIIEQWIVRGTIRRSKASIEDYLPTRYEFTSDALSFGYLTIGSYNTVLGVLDQDGHMLYFTNGEITYQDKNIQINIGALCERLGLTLTDTWTIVLSGINTNE